MDRHRFFQRHRVVWLCLIMWAGLLPASTWAAATIPDDALKALSAGQAVDLIVEYESSAVDREAAGMRRTGERFDRDAVTQLRATRYQALKAAADAAMPSDNVVHVQDYSHLPMSFKRVKSLSALKTLAALSQVRGVYLNKAMHAVAVSANLALVQQPAVSSVGYTGSGSTVVVLDNGMDYTNAAFGGCTAAGTPASTCLVSVYKTIGTGGSDHTHGTNVSAIVLGVAPAAKVAMLDVFSGSSAYTSSILSGINWAIQNRSTYNIVAINMSLGDGSQNTAQCSSGNAYVTPVSNAQKAGITVVAAAGNEAYSNALGLPACTPGIVSVGAVYDSNYGGLSWGSLCTDSSTAADKVTCFSDSASFLTLLAPGAMITAAGITAAGTSQAAPHVAGAIAVLRAAFPSESLSTTLSRLTSTGTAVTDARNGLSKPRINLLAAARPANNAFADRTLISGSAGAASGRNLLGTTESGEPMPVTGAAGHSVWWRWVAPSSGQVSLDTHGSGFDTLLAVYTGTGLSALQTVASNNDDGGSGATSGVLFQAVSGTEYQIEVDGMGSAQGTVALNWSLNATAAANLSVSSLAGPAQAVFGVVNTYQFSVSNAGPQTATNVVATVTLPDGVSLQGSDASCTASGSTVSCALGTLSAGNAVTVNMALLWRANGTQDIQVSVSSDVPDSDASANVASLDVSFDDADAPTLPQWAAMLLASALLFMMARAQRT